MKVLILTNVPSPYRVDFFNLLGMKCSLTVLYERKFASNRDSKWKSYNNSNFKEIFLKGIKVGKDSALSFEVFKYLNKNNFDIIIIGGYATPTSILAIEYLNLKRMAFLMLVDGGIIKKDKKIVFLLKKHFIRSSSFCLSTGNRTDEYLEYYGAKKDNIYKYPFTSLSEKDILEKKLTINEKSYIKKQLAIKEEKIVLSVGQFIHRKGYDILLKACKNIDKNIGVYIIGGKPTKEYIKLKEELNLDNIHFVDFKAKAEVLEYYKMADLFVLPTREDIWGLVINEAMACGLPVITTNNCVAGLELVRDDENGYIVPVGDEKTLSEKINIILNDDALREVMVQNNLDKIKLYTIENMAKVYIDIFNTIIFDKGQ